MSPATGLVNPPIYLGKNTSTAKLAHDFQRKRHTVIAIQHELGIPTRFGTGEKLEDVKEFNSRDFIEQML